MRPVVDSKTAAFMNAIASHAGVVLPDLTDDELVVEIDDPQETLFELMRNFDPRDATPTRDEVRRADAAAAMLSPTEVVTVLARVRNLFAFGRALERGWLDVASLDVTTLDQVREEHLNVFLAMLDAATDHWHARPARLEELPDHFLLAVDPTDAAGLAVRHQLSYEASAVLFACSRAGLVEAGAAEQLVRHLASKSEEIEFLCYLKTPFEGRIPSGLAHRLAQEDPKLGLVAARLDATASGAVDVLIDLATAPESETAANALSLVSSIGRHHADDLLPQGAMRRRIAAAVTAARREGRIKARDAGRVLLNVVPLAGEDLDAALANDMSLLSIYLTGEFSLNRPDPATARRLLATCSAELPNVSWADVRSVAAIAKGVIAAGVEEQVVLREFVVKTRGVPCWTLEAIAEGARRDRGEFPSAGSEGLSLVFAAAETAFTGADRDRLWRLFLGRDTAFLDPEASLLSAAAAVRAR